MDTTDCTYTNDGGTPPTIISSHCEGTTTATGTTTGPIIAYDPFLDASIGIALWIIVACFIVWVILKFK